ncbi:hypothetical protein CDIK_1508 [Cucumispora dikerogammari]|nr:hypothetical protein CDIK_1508 [Cucumispora dikerogammari]
MLKQISLSLISLNSQSLSRPKIFQQPTIVNSFLKIQKLNSSPVDIYNNISSIEIKIDFPESFNSKKYQIPKINKFHFFDNISFTDLDTRVASYIKYKEPRDLSELKKKFEKNKKENCLLVSLLHKNKKGVNPLIKYLEDDSEKRALKISFLFYNPEKKTRKIKLTRVFKELKETIKPLKSIIENKIRNTVRKLNETYISYSILEQRVQEKKNIQIKELLTKHNNEVTSLFDIQENIKTKIIEYLNIAKTFSDLLTNQDLTQDVINNAKEEKRILGFAFINEIKYFIKLTLFEKIKKLDVHENDKSYITQVFEKAFENNEDNKLYFLTRLFKVIKKKIAEASNYLHIETCVFRLNTDTNCLVEIFGIEPGNV